MNFIQIDDDMQDFDFDRFLQAATTASGDPYGMNERYYSINGDWWYDCDYVRCNGILGQFGDSYNDTVLMQCCDPAHEVLLRQWYATPTHEGFTRVDYCTWRDFHAMDNVIAYRGGTGYVYAIYKKDTI